MPGLKHMGPLVGSAPAKLGPFRTLLGSGLDGRFSPSRYALDGTASLIYKLKRDEKKGHLVLTQEFFYLKN